MYIYFGGEGVIDDYLWASSLCMLGSFLKVKEQNARISNIFLVSLIFLIVLLGGCSRCLTQAYVARENKSTPPPSRVRYCVMGTAHMHVGHD